MKLAGSANRTNPSVRFARRSRLLALYVGVAAALAPLAVSAAASCPPAVALAGPPAVVQRIEAMLSRRGVERSAPENCACAQARVSSAGDRYTVSIDDGEGRLSERQVTSLESASTLIETWVRPDLGALGPPPELEVARSIPGGRAVERPNFRVAVASGVETAAGLDASVWAGLSASAGVQVGRLWLGGAGHLARGRLRASESDEHITGSDGAAFAVVGWPFGVGRVRLMPSVGLGWGWWKATSVAADSQGPGEQASESSNAKFRTEVAVLAWLPINRWLSLFGGLAGEYLPQALRVPSDDQAPIESRGYLRMSIGLRLEGP